MILHDKVAIITGGASGLGRAVADALAAGGARVSLFDRDSERGVQAATELGSAAMFEQVDVTSESQVQAGIDATLARFGAIHICINCAGVPDAAKTVADGKPFPLALWDKVIAVNLTGTFNVLRLAAVAMARNEPEGDERGVIINTASVAAFDGQTGQAAYSASKGGVVGMTLPMARDLGRYGIRVMTIAPGIFDTPMMQGVSEEYRQPLIAMVQNPKRFGAPAEYGRLCVSIVENNYLNGETIRIDGSIRMQAK